MTEQHPSDLLAGYALGILDEEDLLVVARHLPGCALCRAEVNAYYQVTDQMALSASPRTPPPGLKDRILRQVGAPPQAAEVAMPVAALRGSPAQPARAGSLWDGLVAMLRGSRAAVGIGIGVMAVLLVALGALLVGQFLPGGRGGMHIVHLDGTQDAPSVQGYLMVFPDEAYGTLVVEDAPPLPQGYQYQLWLVRDGQRASGGVFSVDEHGYAALEVSADHPLNEYASFGVTVEPAGGSPGPTGKKILGGDS